MTGFTAMPRKILAAIFKVDTVLEPTSIIESGPELSAITYAVLVDELIAIAKGKVTGIVELTVLFAPFIAETLFAPLLVTYTILGVGFTVRVKFCVASGDAPFVAVIVKANTPFTVGVPERIPVVPSRVTPVGKEPEVTEKVGAGVPVAATVKLPAIVSVNVAELAEVNAGGTGEG